VKVAATCNGNPSGQNPRPFFGWIPFESGIKPSIAKFRAMPKKHMQNSRARFFGYGFKQALREHSAHVHEVIVLLLAPASPSSRFLMLWERM